MKQQLAANVDEYIAQFPDDVQVKLRQMREVVRATAPEAEELISYAIPSYKLYGLLVHFAAFSKHIGFYPGAGGVAAFKDEIAGYKSAKGSIQFPLDSPLPLDLVKRIVLFRVKQNIEKKNKKR